METRLSSPFIAKLACLAAATTVLGLGAAQVHAQEQQALVASARSTFSDFVRDPEMTWFRDHLGSAKAVLIAPEVVKAGWIFGGSGGRAALYARDAEDHNRWVGPAFYNLGAASVGFQAGLQVSQTVTLVMTDKGLNKLLSDSVKLGGDASVAVGPVGAGANSDITSDFVSFSRSKGLYGGLNLEGSVVSPSKEWNAAYYGKPVLPPDIIVRHDVRNTDGDQLAADIGRASSYR